MSHYMSCSSNTIDRITSEDLGVSLPHGLCLVAPGLIYDGTEPGALNAPAQLLVLLRPDVPLGPHTPDAFVSPSALLIPREASHEPCKCKETLTC